MGTVCVSVMEWDSLRALCVIYRSDNAQANARAQRVWLLNHRAPYLLARELLPLDLAHVFFLALSFLKSDPKCDLVFCYTCCRT